MNIIEKQGESMNHFDIAIIGSGSAGMSAAIYAKRAGKNIAIFEGIFHGGQAARTYEIENYIGIPKISGPDLMNSFYEHTQGWNVPFIYENVDKVEKTSSGNFLIKTTSSEYIANKTIIATGARSLELGLLSEKALQGRGISYCSTCDGSFFKGKPVAVIGGGNTAVEDALYLAELCEIVYLIHRRDTLRADAVLVDKALSNEKIIPIWNSVVEEFIGDKSLEKAIIRDVKSNNITELDISGAFVAIGNKPNSELFEGFVDMDENGYIKTNEKMQTNVDGVYAIGDVRTTPLRQIITAASDGAIAATYACR